MSFICENSYKMNAALILFESMDILTSSHFNQQFNKRTLQFSSDKLISISRKRSGIERLLNGYFARQRVKEEFQIAEIDAIARENVDE